MIICTCCNSVGWFPYLDLESCESQYFFYNIINDMLSVFFLKNIRSEQHENKKRLGPL
jgi:hypothetical protein